MSRRLKNVCKDRFFAGHITGRLSNRKTSPYRLVSKSSQRLEHKKSDIGNPSIEELPDVDILGLLFSNGRASEVEILEYLCNDMHV